MTERWRIIEGDCCESMAAMHAESVDSIVSDPPYGLSFMGKGWDHGVPGAQFWREALRVAKPGAHLLAFGGTRTFHRLAVAIEDAGWEIRDTVMWVYGSGFPKSLDVSKAIDKAAGAEREVVGEGQYAARRPPAGEGVTMHMPAGDPITAPATDAARQWSGWGTALKPAWEPIIVARKPLDGTVAENVLRHGTGAINVDGCRVGQGAKKWETPQGGIWSTDSEAKAQLVDSGVGRWPANLIHDGSDEVMGLFPRSVSRSSDTLQPVKTSKGIKGGAFGNDFARRPDGHPVSDRMRGGFDDSGSAARFYYCAKASKADRDEGCEGLEEAAQDPTREDGAPGGDNPRNRGARLRTNHHPTVKPVDLMRYLCRLVTQPGGLVLDPFCGSGSTGKAALLEGLRFVGCELEPEYVAIAEARCAHAAAATTSEPDPQMSLFEAAS